MCVAGAETRSSLSTEAVRYLSMEKKGIFICSLALHKALLLASVEVQQQDS